MLAISLLAVAGVVLVLLFFVLLGLGSEESGEAASDLVPVDARASGVSGDPAYPDDPAPEGDLPPESTLSQGGNALNSQCEILGSWEPGGLFSGSYGNPSKNRTDPHLTLTDGDLLTVPRGADLTFRYGGEVDPGRDVFDALAFEIEEGELMRAEEFGWLDTWNDKTGDPRPVALPARHSEMGGQGVLEVKADLPPGVYVVPRRWGRGL